MPKDYNLQYVNNFYKSVRKKEEKFRYKHKQILPNILEKTQMFCEYRKNCQI